MIRAVLPVVVALTAGVALLSCAHPGGGPSDSGTPRVLTTTGMIADVAARIAGDAVEVDSLMPPGIDPHLYKASAGDVERLHGASVILYNGLHLEGKMGDILEKMAHDRPVVAVAEAIPETMLREVSGFQGAYDPHVWFDVGLWARTIDPIVDELVRLAPGSADAMRARADALRDEFVALDAWVAESIASIPEDRRVLITAHDAFGYFGERYGIEVLGLQGISTLTEASLQDVDRLVDRIVASAVPAIFVEASVPRRSIEAVQAACADRGHAVGIGGQLFSDSMGAEGTVEGTFVGMVRHNVETIVEALR